MERKKCVEHRIRLFVLQQYEVYLCVCVCVCVLSEREREREREKRKREKERDISEEKKLAKH
jgi:hypothetical protein